MSPRLRVGVIYGGRSGEHEVSLASAASIFANLDLRRYDVVPIEIGLDGRWSLPARPPSLPSAADVIESKRAAQATPVADLPRSEALMVAHPGDTTVVTFDARGTQVGSLALDVVLPVLHGPYGEDGTMQGLLELADVAYVGAGVLASAVGMDKDLMKVVFRQRGLPVVKHLAFTRRRWESAAGEVTADIERALRYPIFVKPANLGSSVGISKAHGPDELGRAIDTAAEYDAKIVVEEGVEDAREIECAVLGNDDPEASVLGEIIPAREFYDYEAKYLDADSRLLVPAPFEPAQTEEIRGLAVTAFRAIDCSGLGRVDFLVSRRTGAVFVNEINTIPGLTTISMYPKLWEATGVPFPALIDRLIALALERQAERRRSRISYQP